MVRSEPARHKTVLGSQPMRKMFVSEHGQERVKPRSFRQGRYLEAKCETVAQRTKKQIWHARPADNAMNELSDIQECLPITRIRG